MRKVLHILFLTLFLFPVSGFAQTSKKSKASKKPAARASAHKSGRKYREWKFNIQAHAMFHTDIRRQRPFRIAQAHAGVGVSYCYLKGLWCTEFQINFELFSLILEDAKGFGFMLLETWNPWYQRGGNIAFVAGIDLGAIGLTSGGAFKFQFLAGAQWEFSPWKGELSSSIIARLLLAPGLYAYQANAFNRTQIVGGIFGVALQLSLGIPLVSRNADGSMSRSVVYGLPKPQKKRKLKITKDDLDGDGIKNKDDLCPKEVGYKINRGCPLTAWQKMDNDRDGVANWKDKCPNHAGPLKFKGCPESMR